MTTSIIGMGSFGRFISTLLPLKHQVVLYSRNPSLATGTLDQALAADIIILAIPLSAYDEFLSANASQIKANSLLVDVCSVKLKPRQIIAKYLPNHPNLLMTHPLFGPESAAKSTKGFNLIVTEKLGDLAEEVIDYCHNDLELIVTEMSADRHDREMAQVHALTFFVGRTLANMQLPPVDFMTPSYQTVLDYIELDKKHSDDLFATIEQGNPYAKQARQDFINSAIATDRGLS